MRCASPSEENSAIGQEARAIFLHSCTSRPPACVAGILRPPGESADLDLATECTHSPERMPGGAPRTTPASAEPGTQADPFSSHMWTICECLTADRKHGSTALATATDLKTVTLPANMSAAMDFARDFEFCTGNMGLQIEL